MNDDLSKYPHERRASDERRDEARDSGDRRQMVHGVRLTFSGTIQSVEDWLDDNCEGDCSVVIAGMSEDLLRKTVEVMFESNTDRDKFKANAGKF